ncbi:uncharacterized protein LOC118436225 [Folsomia candida]|uniref:uncharacterized protein LOC118436225 n=1 Tax=Folsomia candida TaxID=158441 RepID=UPI0016053C76|nr:uncharacterized protein LOC118436225 [Folsomia candida]
MFPIKLQKYWVNSVALLLKYGNFVNSVPLKYSEIDGQFLAVKSLTSLSLMFTTLLVMTLDCTYRVWTIYSRPTQQTSIPDFLVEMTNVIGRSGTGIIGWELFLRRKRCSMFLNSVVKLDANLKRKFGTLHSSRYKSLARFIVIVAIVSALYPILGTLPQQIKDRHHPQYWGSQFIPRPVYDKPLVALLFILYEVNLTFANSFAVGLTVSILYCYIHINSLWLEVVKNRKFSHQGIPISTRLELFSSLKILNIFNNEMAAGILWPTFQNTLLALQVPSHVTLIRFLPNVQPSFVLMVETALGLTMIFQGRCITSGARMFSISNQFKKDVTQFGSRFEKKVAKSLNSLRVEVGSFYFFKMSTFTTFVQTNLDTTISLLLTI